ncbi:MAG: Glutamyl-tRNA(Gln) amidotransferase subunit A [Chlamydiia bacterium]|nr:Glutamyl-tRNA(Gln) amidotransferase subunit A [Chlamydiia bacterium]MCH9615545.1 Glutamyl-tRNA(Gln) amidotransferase subunit A [Chlamydiia bacterium]MCH9629200.1 Glutamyl-tRNA(Gln) amidotransferase subunit A [Chlamydiia bacterium]
MHRKSALDTHNLFMEKKLKATEIAEHHLNLIEIEDPKIGAFLSVHKERVMEKAKKLDQEENPGRLAGIPIAIKDNIHIENTHTTCASKFLQNYRAPFSATAVELLEKEGALLIGKTNLDEFAMGSSCEHSAYKTTHNPHNLDYAPGGSSGGSAAAVASRMVPLSLGSDTGGSIRQPASLCGTFGFKPTYGRVSRYGLVAFGSSLDCIGPFANSAADIALIMEVLGQHCVKDSTSYPAPAENYLDHLDTSLQGKTIGVPWSFLQKYHEKSFNEALETFKSLGVTVKDISLPSLVHSIPIYYILATAEASTNLARFDGVRYGVRNPEAATLEEVYRLSRGAGFGSEVKQRILLGTFVLSSGYQDAYYKKAQKVRTLIINEFKQAFDDVDLIAMPTTPGPAFKLDAIHDPLEMYLQDLYTIGANLAGLPAISVPIAQENGLPLGLQLIGKPLDDGKVIHFAHQFEKERE